LKQERIGLVMHIFMDESGSIGFSSGGTAYFVLAYIAPDSGKHLNKCIKNFNAHLIGNGWNKNEEIKATKLWGAFHNEEIPNSYKYKNNSTLPMTRIFTDLKALPGQLGYAVVQLNNVPETHRKISNCILYNDFAWQLLREPLCCSDMVQLCVDRKNPEYHDQSKFNGHIESHIAFERASRSMGPLGLGITHLHHKSADGKTSGERAQIEFAIRGVEAADFISWAVKRKYENNDERWYSILESRLERKVRMYFK
jgi:Protein of unknown function (DUF3800)